MSFLGGIVSDAVDAYKGSSGGTGLQQFLQKFSTSGQSYVDTIDPLGTFDVKIKFYPTLTAAELSAQTKPDKMDRVIGSLTNSLKGAGESLLDNISGGLYSSNKNKKHSIIKDHDKFGEDKVKLQTEYNHDHTFLEYLAKSNLITCGEQWESSEQSPAPLELQLGFYVQQIQLPNLKLANENKTQNSLLGSFPVTGGFIDTDGILQMEILNTKASLHERIFYPWMREVTLPYWSYNSQPYTTATITIDYTKHNTVKYVFCGCRPIQINLLQGTQQPDASNITRTVSFIYDIMFVLSDLQVMDKPADKLLGVGGSLLKGAANMLNL